MLDIVPGGDLRGRTGPVLLRRFRALVAVQGFEAGKNDGERGFETCRQQPDSTGTASPISTSPSPQRNLTEQRLIRPAVSREPNAS